MSRDRGVIGGRSLTAVLQEKNDTPVSNRLSDPYTSMSPARKAWHINQVLRAHVCSEERGGCEGCPKAVECVRLWDTEMCMVGAVNGTRGLREVVTKFEQILKEAKAP